MVCPIPYGDHNKLQRVFRLNTARCIAVRCVIRCEQILTYIRMADLKFAIEEA